MDALSQSLAGLPAFLLYFGLGLALLVVFLAVYSAVTPYGELALIRDGNAGRCDFTRAVPRSGSFCRSRARSRTV